MQQGPHEPHGPIKEERTHNSGSTCNRSSTLPGFRNNGYLHRKQVVANSEAEKLNHEDLSSRFWITLENRNVMMTKSLQVTITADPE
ncbi:hypothetical protein PBY51_005558 [Eleginops maclovinus]|uniref:Uncharacterized protein n=1 Tax=Eleginops maclovinus TaxID=56733 RepID=A0AAN7X6G6_ELEMC|nr:hypothetical protein PBY51_005558 [Eleginops maclovinus]